MGFRIRCAPTSAPGSGASSTDRAAVAAPARGEGAVVEEQVDAGRGMMTASFPGTPTVRSRAPVSRRATAAPGAARLCHPAGLVRARPARRADADARPAHRRLFKSKRASRSTRWASSGTTGAGPAGPPSATENPLNAIAAEWLVGCAGWPRSSGPVDLAACGTAKRWIGGSGC